MIIIINIITILFVAEQPAVEASNINLRRALRELMDEPEHFTEALNEPNVTNGE